MDLLKSKIFPFFKRVKKILTWPYLFFFKIFIKNKENKNINNADFDKKLIYSLSKSKIPNLNQIRHFSKVLSKKELWAIRFFTFLIFLNLAIVGFVFLRNHLVITPISGGEYAEAVVGSPKYINPLYSSLSDVDSDITKLIFSSLFKYDKNGNLINDLAERYEISEDGKTYTFYIKDDVYWHQGEKLTVDDVIFTFNAIKNPAYGSSLRFSFNGVEIEKKSDESASFILSEKCAPFLSLLTFGILPQDLWTQISPNTVGLAEPNLKPIGSGPYQFKSLVKDKLGNIKSYNLVVNDRYYGKKPFLKKITFKFFTNFTEAVSALNENMVDGISYLPKENKNDLISRDSLKLYNLELPQIKAIFFNQGKNENLKDVKVRQALAFAISKKSLINDVLGAGAKEAHGPILENSFAYNKEIEKYDFNKEKAESLLDEAGWEKISISKEEVAEIIFKEETSTSTENKIEKEEENKKLVGAGQWRIKKKVEDKNKKTTLSKAEENKEAKENKYLIIQLTVIDDEENRMISQAIKNYWEQIGVKTIINFVSVDQIQSSIVKTRNFEALFFSQALDNDPDSYVFWHSSQAEEGGLNISNYKNEEVDKLLEDARLTLNINERTEKYKNFQQILNTDVPAIFLYSPFYTYVQDKKTKGFDIKNISEPSDRFSNIDEWYSKTGKRLSW